MGAGRAGGNHGMVGALQTELDRHIAGGEIDDTAGNEERRNPARTLLVQNNGVGGDALDTADAGADQHPGRALVLVALRPPAGVVERLARRAHAENDEIVDLALLLRLHPLIGIVGAVGAVAARHHAGDLAGYVGDVEAFDLFHAALALEQALPCRFHAASERREHPHPGDDDTSHGRLRAKLNAPTLHRGIAHTPATNEAIEHAWWLSLSF